MGHFLPLLVPRAKVYEYGHGYVTFTTAEWILLEATRVSTGAGGHVSLTTEELQRHLDLLHSAGWTTTHTVGHVHVLRRDTSAPHGLAERIRKLTTSRVAPSPQATTGAQQRSTTQNQEQQRRN